MLTLSKVFGLSEKAGNFDSKLSCFLHGQRKISETSYNPQYKKNQSAPGRYIKAPIQINPDRQSDYDGQHH